MWRKIFLWNYIYKELITYPVYANPSYWWNFGVLSFVCLSIQVVTGIFLAMYYNATSETAFLSVGTHYARFNYGWLVRYVHSNGALFFFLCTYLLWYIGITILVLMNSIAFLSYGLSWGQISLTLVCKLKVLVVENLHI